MNWWFVAALISAAFPDEISLATGEQNVSGDSKLQEKFEQIFDDHNLLIFFYTFF